MNEHLTLSIEETSQQLGICTKGVYDLCHRADFPCIRLGKRIRISREGLAEWVRNQEQNRAEVSA